jgi:hypothetical protein
MLCACAITEEVLVSLRYAKTYGPNAIASPGLYNAASAAWLALLASSPVVRKATRLLLCLLLNRWFRCENWSEGNSEKLIHLVLDKALHL